VSKSSPKRYSQRQLTKIFCSQADIPTGQVTDMQQRWWYNPTNDNSLRLSLAGLQFVKANLKLQSYEFNLPDEDLSNKHLLQLERVFQGMFYLLKRKKIIVFEEQEAMMLTLYSGDLKSYLDSLESTHD
jgi:hypothetical protein